MNRRDNSRVTIIAELHPQHGGSIANLQNMILESKLGGADLVKVQLYDSQTLFGDLQRDYFQINRDELERIKGWADRFEIELFASVFDAERLAWCEELGFTKYKIASRSVSDTDLCEAVLATGKQTFVSLGNYPWRQQGFPYKADNLVYFYCVSNYPAVMEDIQMPHFSAEGVLGYSDHTIGIAACLHAVSRGARYLEKHFTLNKAAQAPMEKAHLGAMTVDELRQLRNLSDDISRLRIVQAEK